MKKSLLAVLLALIMVLSFASLAMADNEVTFTLTANKDAFLLGQSSAKATLHIQQDGTPAEINPPTEFFSVDGGSLQPVSKEEDATVKKEYEYKLKLTKGSVAEYLDYGTTSKQIDIDTTQAGSFTYAVTLVKQVKTYNGTKSAWGTPSTTYESVSDVTAGSDIITVESGLKSAQVSTSSSTTYYEALSTTKAAATVTVDADYAPTSKGCYYLELETATGWDILSVKQGSSTLTAGKSNYYEFSIGSTRTTNITVKVKNANNDSITYVYTIKQEANIKLTDMTVYFGDYKYAWNSTYALNLYPAFASDVYTYDAFVPYSKGTADVLHAVATASATSTVKFTVNTTSTYNGSYDSKTDDWSFTDEAQKFKVSNDSYNSDSQTLVVTAYDANDETVKKEYTIRLHASNAKAGIDAAISDVDVLSNKVNSGTFTDTKNTYDTTKAEQDFYIDADQKYAKLTVTLKDKYAYLIVDGEVQTWNNTGIYNVTAKEVKTGAKTSFKLAVMAEDCSTVKEYTVNVSNGSKGKLTALTADGMSLTPVFDGQKYNYTGYVANAVTSTKISATAADSTATVYIEGKSATASGKGSKYDTFALQEGLNTFEITVYTSSTDYAVYYLNIYRIPTKYTATVSKQSVVVGYYPEELKCYNINGLNFIQLRDFASIIKGTYKQFNVEYDKTADAASMTSNTAYTGDTTASLATKVSPTVSRQKFMLDKVAITPMAYNIDGYNYIMLRDLCAIFDIGCKYDKTTNVITLDGSKTATYDPTL